MKKFIATVSLILSLFAVCMISACKGVPAESIVLSETSVTLESKQTAELTYTVLPEEAKVKVEISDPTVVKYESGTLTALSTGTATVKVYSVADTSVYDECEVTVGVPAGYKAYSDGDCKFVYPSSWSSQSIAGATAAYVYTSTGSSVNLVKEAKNNAYFRANANTFKNTVQSSLQSAGYSVTFKNCSVSKDNWLGYSRVHVYYDYTMGGTDLHQEQVILHSGSKTCILTVTFNESYKNEDTINTIISEFAGHN